MKESNIRIYQKEQKEPHLIEICKYPSNEDLRYLFENYVILKYFGIDTLDGFNPENAKKGLWIQRIQLTENIKISKSLPDLYHLIKDSKLEIPRTKKTIGNSLFESLENCLNLNNKKHETPKNLVDKQFPDDSYKPVSEPETKSYLLIKYKNPDIEKKVETIMSLVKSLGINNPKINRLYKKYESKHLPLKK